MMETIERVTTGDPLLEENGAPAASPARERARGRVFANGRPPGVELTGQAVELPVLFTRDEAAEPDRPVLGRITELEPNGCLIVTDQPLEEHERISLRFDRCYFQFGRGCVRPAREGTIGGRVHSRRDFSTGATPHRIPEQDLPSSLRTFVVRFDRELELSHDRSGRRAAALLGILAFAAVVAVILCFKYRNVDGFADGPLFNLYSLSVALYVLSRFGIAALYRPPRAAGFTPSISVIIAAKDEEESIGRTVDYIFHCDYPPDRLEVIAVDDGSTDRTPHEMELARRRHPGLRVVRFPKNRGKRHAMAEGVRQATGEILVFVDSDTFLHPDALRKLMRGFADPRVAAVCGHAFVQNHCRTHLTRMQEVRYYVSFRILKGAESVMGTVTCCSGCLSGYRRSAVREVLEPWLHQRFLGNEATFGDDRSLTNHLLRRYRILYDSEAICTTIVPEGTRQFFRQQLRWKKSWLRETLIACGFLWKRHPLAAFFFYLQAVISLVSPFCVLTMVLLPLVGFGRLSVLYAAGVLMVALLYGLFYLIRFKDRLWFHGVLFQFVYSIALAWQNYYALLTLRRNHWGTR